MFATFALLLFLLLFTPVFVNTNRYVLVMARETLQTQIIHNLCDYIARSTTSRKGVDDENKHLTTYVLGIVIGGENIDWQLPSSVQTVCELLGVKKSTVYKYRKQTDIKYVQPKRQRRSDALDRQPWWPQASALLDTFWELNCDESPNADDPAEKHDFTCAKNHRYDPVPDNPRKTHRVCVGMYNYGKESNINSL